MVQPAQNQIRITSFEKSLNVSAVNGSAADVGRAVLGSFGSLTVNTDGSYSYVANKGNLPPQIVAPLAKD
jgi:VCBS repeat-containing protein